MKARILVVDDEESIRYSFSAFLSKEGHEVFTAEDFNGAVEYIAGKEPDLVLADIILDGPSGIDLLEEVKKRGLSIPVVMVTGRPSVNTAAESVRMGAFDYIPKPVKKDTLLRVTNQALRYKQLLDENERHRREKEKFRLNLEAIFRSVKDAVITTDSRMHIIEANSATENICGVAPDKIPGRKFKDVFTQCSRSCCKVLEETLKKGSLVREFRVECRHEQRPRQVVTLSCSPLIDIDSKRKGAVLVVRDITELIELERELRERHQFHNIIGKSKKMQETYRLVENLVPTDTTVLITGESGTGKELIAGALHYTGPRAFKPMVTVNCSALAESLLESELFGHVKGSFTGALRDKEGRLKVADGGTLFLDEIGDISQTIQMKLLRALEKKEFEPVGDSKPVKVDVRVIAATNRDLKQEVENGNFRQDLYYRLKVVEIKLPPLRERLEDVPLLVDHFCAIFNKKFQKNIQGVSDRVLRLFMKYNWPGNVRELEHAIEHAFVLCRSGIIDVSDIPQEIVEYSGAEPADWGQAHSDEPKQLLQALNEAGWNKSRAAKTLGVSRQTIYRKIQEYGLKGP